jgi:hypothetical protein
MKITFNNSTSLLDVEYYKLSGDEILVQFETVHHYIDVNEILDTFKKAGFRMVDFSFMGLISDDFVTDSETGRLVPIDDYTLGGDTWIIGKYPYLDSLDIRCSKSLFETLELY